MGAYSERDRERFVTEPEKRSGRSEFARDRARVLHSAALRRLAAKTQVVVPWESDFPRTRLSHSLECGQVGRELGAALGADPDLVETACLAHDLGHPPFGHNGESALAQAAKECGGFEGNAQSLRILTRLEAKSVDAEGRSVGLNLTRAGLDAATKYPWSAAANSQKFGVYADDMEIFTWLRDGAEDHARCLEAQIMDWSDDVAYSVHDLEDALVAGYVSMQQISDSGHRDAIAVVAATTYAPDADEDELLEALRRLEALPYWPDAFHGTHASLASLKVMTSQLIGRFCTAAERATRERFGEQPLRRYEADLVIPREQYLEVAMLKAIAAAFMMRTPEAMTRYAEQREVIGELVHRLSAHADRALGPLFAPAWHAASDAPGRLRVVIDAIASLTDPGALSLLTRLRALPPA